MLLVALVTAIWLSGCVTTDHGNLTNTKPDLKRAARINTQLGVDYIHEGQNDQALAKLQRAIKQDPSYADAHATLAFLYSRLGQTDDARAQYRRALSLDGDNARTRNLYAVFLCSGDAYEEAMAQFHEAISNRSNTSRQIALTNAGVCERRRDRLDAAESYFEKALQADARYAPALLQMADLSYREHNNLRARAFIQRYHDLAPDSAASLALAYRIEKALGHETMAAAYRKKLQQEYPDSNQTVELLESVKP